METALASFFPSFIWVLRDFALRLEDDDLNQITIQEYLENCISQREGATDEIFNRNRICHSLTKYFQRRDCVALSRPLQDELLLSQVDAQPYESLKPKFRQQAEEMRETLIAQLVAKTVKGKPMSGSMFVTLAKTYVDAMNTTGVPTITTAWEHVVQVETGKAVMRMT